MEVAAAEVQKAAAALSMWRGDGIWWNLPSRQPGEVMTGTLEVLVMLYVSASPFYIDLYCWASCCFKSNHWILFTKLGLPGNSLTSWSKSSVRTSTSVATGLFSIFAQDFPIVKFTCARSKHAFGQSVVRWDDLDSKGYLIYSIYTYIYIWNYRNSMHVYNETEDDLTAVVWRYKGVVWGQRQVGWSAMKRYLGSEALGWW